jgi:hypothetical protein
VRVTINFGRVLSLALASFLLSGTAVGAAEIAFGVVYTCVDQVGRKAQIKVLRCKGNQCRVFYLNAYTPGGGFETNLDRESVLDMLNGTHGPACTPPGGAAAPARVEQAPAPPPVIADAPPAAVQRPNGAVVMHTPAPRPVNGGGLTLARYECYTYSGGRLNSALAENFSLAGAGRYTDAGGAGGTFTYDAASGQLAFHGAALNGQHATFHPGIQPFKNHPPTVAFPLRDGHDGDTCDARAPYTPA